MELGGNIALVGFREMDSGELIVVKKIVGNYAKKISERCEKFERLTLTKKDVHKQGDSQKYELHAKVVDNGKIHAAEEVDSNFFIALDAVLKRLLDAVTK
ncbi:hypothetical protein C4573_02245 [Candidatus Woesearchaeota archaeon]|nr:MAG: hypothetical protein C4573_02245 [Candidatus Woesearchaeota archaeon]